MSGNSDDQTTKQNGTPATNVSESSPSDTETSNSEKETTTQTTQNTVDRTTPERSETGQNRDRTVGSPSEEGSIADTFRALRTDQQIALGGAIVAVVGSILPWATILGTNIGGLSGDGGVTLVLAIIAGAIAYFEPDTIDKWANGIVGAFGALIVIIGLVDYTSAAAIGLYVTILGGLLIAFPQAQYMYRRYQSGASSQPNK